jgi:hypothetical protein
MKTFTPATIYGLVPVPSTLEMHAPKEQDRPPIAHDVNAALLAWYRHLQTERLASNNELARIREALQELGGEPQLSRRRKARSGNGWRDRPMIGQLSQQPPSRGIVAAPHRSQPTSLSSSARADTAAKTASAVPRHRRQTRCSRSRQARSTARDAQRLHKIQQLVHEHAIYAPLATGRHQRYRPQRRRIRAGSDPGPCLLIALRGRDAGG